MITLITGTPGAGKTLYAISKLILPLIGKTVTRKNENGEEEELPRTVYTNINGLLVDHELIGPGGQWSGNQNKWIFEPMGEGQGLRDWHTWAKPGSVIVYDEFQKVWPPRPNGSPVPPDLQALDTHRHMGVDLVLITQSPNNHDRHVQGLAGRHLHVRRMGNMGLTIVYEWDHCSRSLMYSKAVSKAPWKYDKKVFRLYKSAEVHTKTPRKLPTLAFVAIAALVGALYFVPTAIQRIKHQGEKTAETTQGAAASGKPGQATISSLPEGVQASTYDYTAFIPRLPDQPNSAPAFDALRQVVNMPRVIGGICTQKKGCQCLTEQGTDAGLNDVQCRDWMASRPYDAYTPAPQPQQVQQQEKSASSLEKPQVVDLRFPPEAPRGTTLNEVSQYFPPS